MGKNTKKEQVTESLRSLYEMRGFAQVWPAKFEDYSLYVENKNFFGTENMITFMGTSGKLMALKPDVTLSIVKNIPEKMRNITEKVFYIDQVCRLTKDTGEYKLIDQIGVEIIGSEDPFSSVELVELAVKSLRCISESFVLDISHLGLISGILEDVALPALLKEQVLAALYQKSSHEVDKILKGAAVEEEDTKRIMSLICISGDITAALPKLLPLVRGEQMIKAYEELLLLSETLRKLGMAGQVNLDFSVVNDLDYYNGLVVAGYVEGIPDMILSGGRYDNLLKKMGKQGTAIGFAVFLSELEGAFREGKPRDFDVLISYDEDTDYAALLKEADMFVGSGKSVRLERGDGRLLKVSQRYRFKEGKLFAEDE